MQGFWLEGFVLPKSSKSRSLIAGFSFQVLVQLAILGEHLSNSIHGGNNYLSSSNQHIHHHHLSLLTLCGKRVKQSQTVRIGRFESNLLTWPGRPNTHAWEQSHPRNSSLQFPLHGTGPPPSSTAVRRLCTRH